MERQTYRINNHDLADPIRAIPRILSDQEIESLQTEGYLVRERLLSDAEIVTLRAAVDRLAESHGGAQSAGTTGTFGGLFVRRIVEADEVFWDLAKDDRFLGAARQILGPQVQLHASVLRITYPGQPNQETHWHFHQRVVPDPIPPFFSHPRVLDNLIYLDDLDLATGPFCVVPGTHLNLTEELPAGIKTDLPGQRVLEVPAGSAVSADAALWHRGMPTTPAGRVRRLLILGYSPTWMKMVDAPTPEFIARDSNQPHQELLGQTGFY